MHVFQTCRINVIVVMDSMCIVWKRSHRKGECERRRLACQPWKCHRLRRRGGTDTFSLFVPRDGAETIVLCDLCGGASFLLRDDAGASFLQAIVLLDFASSLYIRTAKATMLSSVWSVGSHWRLPLESVKGTPFFKLNSSESLANWSTFFCKAAYSR